VVQGKPVEARRLDRWRPGGALQVRARGAQPLQGEREGDALGVVAEPAAFGAAVEDLGQTLALPQRPKTKAGPQVLASRATKRSSLAAAITLRRVLKRANAWTRLSSLPVATSRSRRPRLATSS
jgi:hypothetical protein